MNYVKVKCVKNGIESNTSNIFVTIKKPSIIPTPLLFILCALGFVVILFAFKFYANKPLNFNGKSEQKDENN